MSEQWRPVAGYSGRYEVSDQGRVRSWAPYNGQPIPRVLSPGTYKSGHTHVGLCLNGEQTTHAVHRLVAAAFLGVRPAGHEVRHLNGDPTDNRLANLVYGSRDENMRDRVRHGTDPNASRDRCRKGHLYTPENTHVRANGHRVCRRCARAWGGKSDRRRRRVETGEDSYTVKAGGDR